MDESAHHVARTTRSYQYADANDRKKHFAEIQAIAEKVDRPVSEVAERSEEELKRMAATAAITDFLLVLVSKKVRQCYRIEH